MGPLTGIDGYNADMDARLCVIAAIIGLLIGMVCAESDESSVVRVRLSSWAWALFAGCTLDYWSGKRYTPETAWGCVPWAILGIGASYFAVYIWNRYCNARNPVPYDVSTRNVATFLLIVCMVFASSIADVVNPTTRALAIEESRHIPPLHETR